MLAIETFPQSSSDIFAQATTLTDALIKPGPNDSGTATSRLFRLYQLIESLPLATSEFSLASNRLRNAGRYLQANESGAAAWELNALRNQLKSLCNTPVCEPKRRVRRHGTTQLK